MQKGDIMANTTTIKEINEELDIITTQAAALKEETQVWKVNAAPLTTNEEIKELYSNSIVTFNNLLNRITPMLERLTQDKNQIEQKLNMNINCNNEIRKLQKEVTKLDFLVAGLESYLWVCKKDIKELTGQNEF